MTDFEKVVKGLSACINSYKTCQGGSCPYKSLPDEYSCSDELMKDALALISEQQEKIQRLCDALKPEPPKEEKDECNR